LWLRRVVLGIVGALGTRGVVGAFVGGGPLGLQNDALQLFEYGKLFVGVIDLGVALTLADKETYFLQTLKFALDIAGILFDKLSQAPYMGLEIRIFRVNHDDFASNPGRDESIKHKSFVVSLTTNSIHKSSQRLQ
jgi:hypothetical protein